MNAESVHQGFAHEVPFTRIEELRRLERQAHEARRGLWAHVNARSGKVVHVVAERKNSELFLALFDALRRAYRRAKRIRLVLDNFIVHKSRKTRRHLGQLGGGVVLHFLPLYSPESNVIELLWKQLHDHVTRNHTHRAIEPLMEAADEVIEGAQPSREPRSRCSPMRREAVSGTVQAI